jgi:ClpP class serine protease
MSAQRARQGKLVDREGGLSAAIDEARKRGQLAPDAPLQIWPPRPGLLQALGELSSGGSDARSTLLSSLGVAVHAAVIEALLSTGDPVAAVLPFSLSIE